MKVLPIERVLREYERLLEKGVRASRIFPELLSRCERIVDRYRMLKEAMEVGVKEVAYNVEAKGVNHPYPPEVLRVGKAVGGGRWFPSVDKGDGIAYVFLFRTDYPRNYYAVVPYREWPDLLGEPDLDLDGVKAFSVERFIGYLDRCWEYCRLARFCWYEPEKALAELSETLEEAKRRVEESSYVIPLATIGGYYRGHYVIEDERLRSRGVRAVKALPFSFPFEWIEKYGEKIFYCVVPEDDGREIEEEYRAYIEVERVRERRLEELWNEIMEKGKVSDKLVKVGLEDLERIFEAINRSGYEEVMKAIRELCDPDEIYLQRQGYNSPYRNAGLSPFHPVGMLYIVRRFRELGLGRASVFKKADRKIRNTPSLLVSTDEGFFPPKGGYWQILVKPKRGLEIEYPCEARWEDGNIVIIDRKRVEEALAETR